MAVTVPMTGPRSRALGAPQRIGKRGGAPLPGCEVRRICPVSLLMAIRGAGRAEKQKAFSSGTPDERLQSGIMGGKRRFCKVPARAILGQFGAHRWPRGACETQLECLNTRAGRGSRFQGIAERP